MYNDLFHNNLYGIEGHTFVFLKYGEHLSKYGWNSLLEIVTLLEQFDQASKNYLECSLVDCIPLLNENASFNASGHAHHATQAHIIGFRRLHSLAHLGLIEDVLQVFLKVNLGLELTKHKHRCQKEPLLNCMVLRIQTPNQSLQRIVQVRTHLISKVTSQILLFKSLFSLI